MKSEQAKKMFVVTYVHWSGEDDYWDTDEYRVVALCSTMPAAQDVVSMESGNVSVDESLDVVKRGYCSVRILKMERVICAGPGEQTRCYAEHRWEIQELYVDEVVNNDNRDNNNTEHNNVTHKGDTEMKSITNEKNPAIIWACEIEFKDDDTVSKNGFASAQEALDWAGEYVIELCEKHDTVVIPHRVHLTSSIRREF